MAASELSGVASRAAVAIVGCARQTCPRQAERFLKALCLHDRHEIEAFLRRNASFHVYDIGDLDDFFWNYTTWYALRKQGRVRAIALMYTGMQVPTLLAFTDSDPVCAQRLLESLLPVLPRRFYAHLSPGMDKVLAREFILDAHGEHYKMALMHRNMIDAIDTSGVVPLSTGDLADLLALYRLAYPENWFDPRMLETGQYYGIRGDEGLLAAAGVHVYSLRYRVAALGNIATHPAWRGQGLAKAVTARTCKALLRTVEDIGLNVKSDNQAAISCYISLGFEVVGTYGEFMAEAS